MEFLIVSVLNGVVHGLLLFMVSAGLTLIFGMMGVLNFAHAWFYMLGAYVGFTLTRTVGFWAGLIAAPLIVARFTKSQCRPCPARRYRSGRISGSPVWSFSRPGSTTCWSRCSR